MNIKKVIKEVILLLLLLSSLFIMYLLENSEWAQEHILYPSRARSTAKKYIYEKYGIMAEIQNVEIEIVKYHDNLQLLEWEIKEPRQLPYPIEEATVRMSYKGEEFDVYVSWGEDAEQYDNYQKETIEDAVKEAITEMVGKPDYLYFDCGLYNKYFDGSNLLEVLESCFEERNVSYVIMNDVGLSNLSYDKMVERFGDEFELTFLNCKDKTSVKKILELEKDNFITYPWDIDKYTPYLNEYYYHNYIKGFLEYGRIFQYRNFYYYYSDGSYCNIKERKMDDFLEWDDEGILKNRSAYKVYSLDTDAKFITMVVPVEKYNIDIIQLYEKNGKKYYFKVKGEEILDGKYNVFDIGNDNGWIVFCKYSKKPQG